MRFVKMMLSISVFAIGAVSLLTACSTLQTATLPMKDGNYKIIATAVSSSEASSGAVKTAEKVCASQGKLFKVISINTVYQGIGKEVGALTSIASEVAWQTSKTAISSTRSTEDYQTTLVFSCS